MDPRTRRGVGLIVNGSLSLFLVAATVFLSFDNRTMYATKVSFVDPPVMYISSMTTAAKLNTSDWPTETFDNPSQPCQNLAKSAWCRWSFASTVLFVFFGAVATFGFCVYFLKPPAQKNARGIIARVGLLCYLIFFIFTVMATVAAHKMHIQSLPSCDKTGCHREDAPGYSGPQILIALAAYAAASGLLTAYLILRSEYNLP